MTRGLISMVNGDALNIPLADGIIQTVITSPPYWGLRDYGVLGQLGLEPTPEEYIEKMVMVFREVWRVMRPDATLWLNIGDCYAGAPNGRSAADTKALGGDDRTFRDKPFSTVTVKSKRIERGAGRWGGGNNHAVNLKPKDLVMMPARLALALQADGWWIRSDIIWAKPNPMPESVTDRPTKNYEHVFLLVKGQWKTSVIKFTNLPGERFHFFENFGFGPSESARTWPPATIDHSSLIELCICLAASIFDFAQLQHNFSLPPFYSEIWQESADSINGILVCGNPVIHRAVILAALFINARATAKEFLCKLNSLGIALTNGNYLLIGGGAAKVPLTPSIYGNGNATITINHSGEICKLDFIHDQIIIQKPDKCNYYYDAEAIKEPLQDSSIERAKYSWNGKMVFDDDGYERRSQPDPIETMGDRWSPPSGRNRRDVWTIATESFSGAHFATFPQKLVEPMILAGSSPQACETCGAPWRRVLEMRRKGKDWNRNNRDGGDRLEVGQSASEAMPNNYLPPATIGWRPTCACERNTGVGRCLVFDPFAGTGTVGKVSVKHGRRFVGLELKAEYIELARARTARTQMVMQV